MTDHLSLFFFFIGLGNIPSGASPSMLEKAFDKYGTIESIRILSHKTCAFINFDSIASASDAQDAFLQQQVDLVGFENARIGFAKVPPPPPVTSSPSTTTASSNTNNNKSDHHQQQKKQQQQQQQQQPSPDLSSSSSSSSATHPRRSPKLATNHNNNDAIYTPKSHQETLDELWYLMTSLGCSPKDKVLLQGKKEKKNTIYFLWIYKIHTHN